MRFSAKIFLSTAVVGGVGVLAGSLFVYQAAHGLFVRDYEHDYGVRLELLAKDFSAQERIYQRVALNAAKVVKELDAKRAGKWTDGALQSLAADLGVDNIKISDATGVFRASGDGNLSGNLFGFCPAYRGLLSGDSNLAQTPLVPDARNLGRAALYTMIPSADRRRVIDISVQFGELSKMLQRLVEDESDITYVALSAPGGIVIGEVGAKNSLAESTIRATVHSGIAECCECQVRGLVQAGKPYVYELSAEISGLSLRRSVADLQKRFWGIAVLLTLLSLAVAFWVTRILLARIQSIRSAVDKIAAAKDFAHTIPLREGAASGDELDALARHFNQMFASMQEAQSELIEAKKAEARASIAAQVAHDIRSPLTSMTLALNRLQALLQPAGTQAAEMFSILSHGVSRVSGIVQRLSRAHGPASGMAIEAPRLTLVDKLFFDVAQEAALKLPASQKLIIEGFAAVPEIWAVVQVTEMQTALSNVLNNASEATAAGRGAEIRLHCSAGAKELVITIRDQGPGIPAEILGRVFEREFTSGKAGGSGLGLYQARKAVEWCGGRIQIESKPGEGTTVVLTLPTEKPPNWLVDQVIVPKGGALVVADDDPMILEAWREKAGSIACHLFPSLHALDEALPTLGSVEKLVFVLDQYAGEGLNGTAFLEKHGLGARAILSTTEYDDPAIQDKIKALKAHLLPKARLGAVQVLLGK